MMPHYALFINGRFIDTKEKQNILNPSTGKVIAEAAVASIKEVDLAIASAREAFDKGPWPRISLDERKKVIQNICQGILNKAGELAKIETENTGKPIKESTFIDIPSAARTFEHIADNFQNYLNEELLNVQGEANIKLTREPIGVVVLIVPWNYPLLIASWKLASALAAGNTVILKPSSLTPLSVLELAKVINESGVPKGAVNIIN